MYDKPTLTETAEAAPPRRKPPGVPATNKRVTLRMLAEELDLTIGTVSRILSDKGDNYATATRQRVHEAAARLKYRPNALIRGIQTGRTGTAAVILSPNSSFSRGILNGIHDLFFEQQTVMLLNWNNRPDREPAAEQEMIHQMIDRCVDGFLLLRSSHHLHALYADEVLARNLPLVVIDSELEPQRTDFVGTDDHQGGRAAAEYLLSLGHRQLLFVGHSGQIITSRRREEGFREVITQSPNAGGEWLDTGREQVGNLVLERLRGAAAPTAIFCYNDHYALAVARALLEAGLRIPQDVSLVGFGDVQEAEPVIPLTTFDQHPAEIGRVAARLYLDHIENDSWINAPDVQRRLVPADLVVRASTRAIG